MRQLLLRVPDELHRRLARRAKRERRSVNAVANEMLGASVDLDIGVARDSIRARAAAHGLLLVTPPSGAQAPSLADVRARMRHVVLSAVELIEEGRFAQ
ncbi:MAG: toxin-antitoxin system HicB family antitoxin [Ilumatobacteraceae bacterium]